MLPDWVEKYKKPGTTIKKIGNGYYLYTATSKSVSGKNHPVSVQNYLGRITENGIIDARRHIRIGDTQAGHLRDFAPGVDADLADIVLLEFRGEWYYTKTPAAKIKRLADLGLYKDGKLTGGQDTWQKKT